MKEKNIIVGYYVAKPIVTQEECDAYSTMAQIVSTHNSQVAAGDKYWEIDDKEDRYEVIEGKNVPSEDTMLDGAKKFKISESKTVLSEHLASHPLQWTDGKYYSVTSEKQALLTSNLSLYQLAVSNGQSFTLKWNTTGDECTVWKYDDLAALALAIGTYVQPFVSRQQELELDNKACTTMEELDAVEINYDPVLKQYLETVGLKEVTE